MRELLELHRASAGSGKTFALARKFIWYYITVRDQEEGPRRLRTKEELRDSLRHILAITFTNKATNEMQQRIVEKLDALAYPPKDKLPDYMEDFSTELCDSEEDEAKGECRRNISNTCRIALRLLLENYSDFQVSTIDSFFQLVLRTFAYETGLSDTYAIELDSKYLAKVAIDSTISDIKEKKAPVAVMNWLEMLMERSRLNNEQWNFFQRNERRDSAYGRLLSSSGYMENEDFKKIRHSLEQYLERTPDLWDIYLYLDKKYEKRLKTLTELPYRRMQDAAKKLVNLKSDRDYKQIQKYMFSHAGKCLEYDQLIPPAVKDKVSGKRDFAALDIDEQSFLNSVTGKKYLNSKERDPEIHDVLDPIYLDMLATRREWIEACEDSECHHWKLYRENFPYLGLLQETMRKRREYLRDSNAVELGETSMLLRSIIGKDDAPFVYERLGTRLNHFLIDEFQDTSRMQWDNLCPLLEESMGRNNESLLIGDAKQSIYRFRNADPSLISHEVERRWRGNVHTVGDLPGENVNWRSDPVIVEFNNGFFSYLSGRLSEYAGEITGDSIGFSNLYANVSQRLHPKKRDDVSRTHGYVEIKFIKKESADKDCADNGGTPVAEPKKPEEKILDMLPGTVCELLARGYQLGDIAVLVDTNDHGEQVVRKFTEYNAGIGEEGTRIEFISEQSLKVGSSSSVKLIITALEMIARGEAPEIRRGEEARKKGVADWNLMKCNFRIFALRHNELPPSEQLRLFMMQEDSRNALGEMLAAMPAMTLPALVEAITADLVTETMRNTDAPFIAAFQDMVLEYSESHPSDIVSFLDWWKLKGFSASIASPGKTNAVTVLTIHKAKGLEFPCVLMPFANKSFFVASSKKIEWRWVEPKGINPDGRELPPYLPVNTGPDMVGTVYENYFNEYLDMVSMDILNSLYVGFTRAVNELYIFIAEGSKAKCNTSGFLRDFSGQKDAYIITFGKRYDVCPVERETEENPVRPVGTYESHRPSCRLMFSEEGLFTAIEEKSEPDENGNENVAETADPEADRNPRSEGNILHAIMERIATLDDIRDAVTYMRRKGMVPSCRADEVIGCLHEWLSVPEAKSWFDGAAKVISERSLIGDGKVCRPDRVMVMPDGGAVVVDYKFGDVQNESKYHSQVRKYIRNLTHTGKFSYVKGFLWYVKERRIIEVKNKL